MKKDIKLIDYLKDVITPIAKEILKNYFLKDISITLFFKVFGNRVDSNPCSVLEFILDSKNGYELCLLGARVSGQSNIPAYNGKNNLYDSNGKCSKYTANNDLILLKQY